jgi:hypothetical protein
VIFCFDLQIVTRHSEPPLEKKVNITIFGTQKYDYHNRKIFFINQLQKNQTKDQINFEKM